jgi:Fur family ferric uptake transcriptional regulator
MDRAADTDLLHDRGLRVTAARLAVLDVLREQPHATADEVARVTRARVGTVSTQAVYDILHAFHGADLVRRIQPAGGAARYETRVGDNHHHLICRACGATADVACAVGAAPCLEPEDAAGFVVDQAEVIFWGLCPECANRRKEPA